jgi:hypothetical protein
LTVTAAMAVLAFGGPARADANADAIAQRMLAHDAFGFEGAELHARLMIAEASGKSQERAFDAKSKRSADGDVRTLVRFTAPGNIAGTAFLLIAHASGADEQYVYLPRMKTTRRIGGTAERDGSFMGSDFTYADLERKDLKQATFAKLGEETVGKDACDKLEAVPKGASPYARIEVWVRKSDAIPLRIRWFGKDGQAEKALFVRRVRTVDGHPIIAECTVENAKIAHKTDLAIDDLKFRTDIADAELTPAALAH